MVALVFQAGPNRYGLDIAQIVEVVPLVLFRPVPSTPAYVAGTFDYRGTIVPVIDLSSLLTGQACEPRMSARIMLVEYGLVGEGAILGMLAEGVTETRRYEASDVRPPSITPEGSECLGDVIADDRGMVQLIRVADILPDELKRTLFADRIGNER